MYPLMNMKELDYLVNIQPPAYSNGFLRCDVDLDNLYLNLFKKFDEDEYDNFATTDLNSVCDVALSNDAFMDLQMNKHHYATNADSQEIQFLSYEDKILAEDDDHDLNKFNNMNSVIDLTKADYKSIKNCNIKNST